MRLLCKTETSIVVLENVEDIKDKPKYILEANQSIGQCSQFT